MYILGIETTGAFASVALLHDDKIIGHISGNDRFSHLQNLIPQVEAVIKNSKLSLGDLDAIAVSCGPGSFTGIRIGVSTARALSQILDIPCVPVSSLEALVLRGEDFAKAQVSGDAKTHAASVQDSLGEKAQPLLICPMLDARRSQVYAGGYVLQSEGTTEGETKNMTEGCVPTEVIPAGPYMLDEFLSKTMEYHRILLLGDAIDKYGEKIREMRSESIEFAAESIRYQDAAFAARLGAAIFHEKGGLSYNEIEPDYMRMAEAERKLREKQAASR